MSDQPKQSTVEETIPCLSLWQPWATLMAIGAKKNETRSWETMYRGPLAIHAAKKWSGDLAHVVCRDPYRTVLDGLWPSGTSAHDMGGKGLPLGCIVAVVRLHACIRIGERNAPPAGSNEFEFGDYTPGRFAWCTDNVQRLETPIPWKGAQGLFRVPISAITLATQEQEREHG